MPTVRKLDLRAVGGPKRLLTKTETNEMRSERALTCAAGARPASLLAVMLEFKIA